VTFIYFYLKGAPSIPIYVTSRRECKRKNVKRNKLITEKMSV